MGEEIFAIHPSFGSTAPVSSTMKSSQKRYSLSLTPKEPSLSCSAVTPVLHNSWHSSHNLTFLSLGSPTSNVGRGENVCCPGSVAKIRGGHESTQTHPYDKCSKKVTGFCPKICRPSHKKLPNLTGAQTFFILYVLLDHILRRGPLMLLSLLLVSMVLPNRGAARNGLCSACSNRPKISSNHLNSTYVRKKDMANEKKTSIV